MKFKVNISKPKDTPWQLIYIDMMTNMMIFFVVLWVLGKGKASEVDATGDTTTRLIDLPSDILFSSGKAALTQDGRKIFERLFKDDGGSVLSFESAGAVKRHLVIHGHTDNDGKKNDNFTLGFRRALSALEEIRRFSSEISGNVILCTHADNSPKEAVPHFAGKLSKTQQQLLKDAKHKNRRIGIEDKLTTPTGEE